MHKNIQFLWWSYGYTQKAQIKVNFFSLPLEVNQNGLYTYYKKRENLDNKFEKIVN